MKTLLRFSKALAVTGIALLVSGSLAFAESSDFRSILTSGLLGAGVGAISAEASGGKAGMGALIGAGTNIIGGAILGFLTEPAGGSRQAVYNYAPVAPASYYAVPAQTSASVPVPTPQPEPVYYYAPAPVYNAPLREDPNKKILKQGLLGAGVGAISSSASGGSAGKGALIGAGTNVIGGALLDFLTEPSAPAYPYYTASQTPVYANYSASQAHANTVPHKRIVRKYDGEGKLISEEEFWD